MKIVTLARIRAYAATCGPEAGLARHPRRCPIALAVKAAIGGSIRVQPSISELRPLIVEQWTAPDGRRIRDLAVEPAVAALAELIDRHAAEYSLVSAERLLALCDRIAEERHANR